MKFKRMKKFQILLVLTLIVSFLPLSVQAETITQNCTGTHEGYYYEYSKDIGTGTMELEEGKVGFSCNWSDIHIIFFDYGMIYNQDKTHQEMGNISISYECSYESIAETDQYTIAGIFGLTLYPSVGFFIVESHDNWKPKANKSPIKTIVVDGAEYDIYEYIYPSFENPSYEYYFVRREPRTSGTISVSKHLRELEALKVKLGKIYKIVFTFEGYKSEGSAELTKLNIDIALPGDVNEDGNIDSLDFAILRKYLLGKIETISSNADVNQDSNINSLDFAWLKIHLLGKIDLGDKFATS